MRDPSIQTICVAWSTTSDHHVKGSFERGRIIRARLDKIYDRAGDGIGCIKNGKVYQASQGSICAGKFIIDNESCSIVTSSVHVFGNGSGRIAIHVRLCVVIYSVKIKCPAIGQHIAIGIRGSAAIQAHFLIVVKAGWNCNHGHGRSVYGHLQEKRKGATRGRIEVVACIGQDVRHLDRTTSRITWVIETGQRNLYFNKISCSHCACSVCKYRTQHARRCRNGTGGWTQHRTIPLLDGDRSYHANVKSEPKFCTANICGGTAISHEKIC